MNFPWLYNWKMVAATLLSSILTALGVLVPSGPLPTTPQPVTPRPSASAPAVGPPATTSHPRATPTLKSTPSTAPSSTSPRSTPPATPAGQARVIVRFTSDDAATRVRVISAAASAAGLANAHVVRELATGALLVQADGDAEAFLASLQAHPGVVAASPNSSVTRAATATDPLFGSQWALPSGGGGVGFSTVWDRTLGAGARVAVIDTGKTNHPDLAGQWLGGFDFVNDADAAGDGNGRDSDATDMGDYCSSRGEISSWHGTHVAGIIAARRNNGIGIAGAAPGAKIVPVRVLARCGGEMADLIDAIVWSAGGKVPGMAANPHPARVINMSLSSREECSLELQTALSMARRLGAVSVVAAGNYTLPASQYAPGNCSGVLTVAASTKARTMATYSNHGAGVNLAAPGGEDGAGTGIISTWLNDSTTNNGGYSYGWMSGTSMAAPYVAGAAAMLLSLKPNLTASEVQQILTSTAVSSSACSGCGAGILDAAAAIAQVPTLTSVTLSGRQVTLSGAGFTRATQVWVGSEALTFTRTGDGTLTATIPVTVPAGTHAVTVSSGDIRSSSRLISLS